jgi:Protein of unknown function (DUF3984)
MEIKRSNSTFFVSSSGGYGKYDWSWRHGARVTAESLEEQGRSWLVSRASSTDIKGLNMVETEDDGATFVADLAVFEGDGHQGVLDDQDDVDEGVTTWLSWFRAMIEIAEDEDEEEERVWTPPKRRAVSFAADNVVGGKTVDEGIVERARERDEEHGLDGWMDGAAYLAFLGVRALGGFF